MATSQKGPGSTGKEGQVTYTDPYVLCAEDNRVDYLFFERAFRQSQPDYPIVHCENGKLTRDFLLQRIRRNDTLPILIVLDIKMPGLSGLEVLEYIRSKPRLTQIPVVMLSASSEERDIQSAYRHCANAYLTKPERYGDLKRLVSTMADFWISYNHRPK
ncbi:response regulator [Lewinella sp. IMCC34191]|uniref:response regulator n=1 Tax=Lewinella sp. IMCC34191 TaxID=2259172 RepID=UPI000E23B991|nr:response regulator [Lewinella sp. IMCC34191]